MVGLAVADSILSAAAHAPRAKADHHADAYSSPAEAQRYSPCEKDRQAYSRTQHTPYAIADGAPNIVADNFFSYHRADVFTYRTAVREARARAPAQSREGGAAQ